MTAEERREKFMNHEDYISNQIAVYKNSKTLIELRDKLKVASLECYAHIHAVTVTALSPVPLE